MDYAMEDTQNSAPGSLPPAQAAKLGAPRKAQDAHSTTKRLVSLSNFTGILANIEAAYKPN
jgi:hypothetical protein